MKTSIQEAAREPLRNKPSGVESGGEQGFLREQRGAIIVEGTLSLSIFMFFMFTLLSLTQIAYTQARMSTALDSVAKAVAEYSHIFYVTGLADATSGGGKTSEIANKLGDYLEQLGGSDKVPGPLGKLIQGSGNALKGDSLSGLLKKLISDGIAAKMMKDSLGEDFYTRNRVENVSFMKSKVLQNGDEVFLQVNYDVRVVKFPILGLDYVFHMSSCSYARAWKGGAS